MTRQPAQRPELPRSSTAAARACAPSRALPFSACVAAWSTSGLTSPTIAPVIAPTGQRGAFSAVTKSPPAAVPRPRAGRSSTGRK